MQFRTRSFVALSMAVLMSVASGCGSSYNGPVGMNVDTVAPNVIATNPPNHAIGVSNVSASFSEAMDASTITTTTFAMVGPDGTSVSGHVTYDATTDIASFTPDRTLAPGTNYSARVTTGAKDVAGNALVNDFVWSFTTSAAVSSFPPVRRSP